LVYHAILFARHIEHHIAFAPLGHSFFKIWGGGGGGGGQKHPQYDPLVFM